MIYIIDHEDSFTWNVVHQFSAFDEVYCSNYFEIDTKKLKSDYSNEKLMLIINNNREIANRLNLRGTPAFIIGNKIYPGAMSEKDIEKAIALERKR